MIWGWCTCKIQDGQNNLFFLHSNIIIQMSDRYMYYSMCCTKQNVYSIYYTTCIVWQAFKSLDRTSQKQQLENCVSPILYRIGGMSYGQKFGALLFCFQVFLYFFEIADWELFPIRSYYTLESSYYNVGTVCKPSYHL